MKGFGTATPPKEGFAGEKETVRDSIENENETSVREDEGIWWLLLLQVPEKLIQSQGLGGRVSGVIRPHQCRDISDGVASH